MSCDKTETNILYFKYGIKKFLIYLNFIICQVYITSLQLILKLQ